MILRAYEPRDRETVMALMEAKDDQLILDPSHPANPITVVMEDDGRVVGALVGRIKLEVHLALDHTVGHPAERLDWVRALYEYGVDSLEGIGAPSIEFAAAPKERSWIKRIEKLPFIKRDERVHFRVMKEVYHGGLQHGGSGDGAALSGSASEGSDDAGGRSDHGSEQPTESGFGSGRTRGSHDATRGRDHGSVRAQAAR